MLTKREEDKPEILSFSTFRFDKFRQLIVTAGNPLNHFDVGWDGRKIGWMQRVNSLDQLDAAVNGKKTCVLLSRAN